MEEMNLWEMDPKALRGLLNHESRKFVWALNLNSSLDDLMKIKERLQEIQKVLKHKETNESQGPNKIDPPPITMVS